MAASWAWARRSASPPPACTPTARWAWNRSPSSAGWYAATARCATRSCSRSRRRPPDSGHTGRSETAAQAEEHGGVTAAGVADGAADADVGIQAEHAHARAQGHGAIAVVGAVGRDRVRAGAGHGLGDGEGLIRRILEFVVPREAGIRTHRALAGPRHLPAQAADQRIKVLVRIGQR